MAPWDGAVPADVLAAARGPGRLRPGELYPFGPRRRLPAAKLTCGIVPRGSNRWHDGTCCRLGRRAADVDALTSTSTEVEIFGAVYHVRGGDDREHLQELADLVDGKMREIAQHMAPAATADPARIAILTALNLADELFRTEKRQEGERVEIREKMAILTEELDSALRS